MATMHRVSSRQRLVSWDAFDATNGRCPSDSESESYEPKILLRKSPSSADTSLLSASSSLVESFVVDNVTSPYYDSADATLKRKRTRRNKKPSTSAVRSQRSQNSTVSPSSSSSSLSSLAQTVPCFSWEHQQNGSSPPPPCVESLYDDVQLHILEFLHPKDSTTVMEVNRRYANLLRSDSSSSLWKEYCHRQWPWLSKVADSVLWINVIAQETTLSQLLPLAVEKAWVIDESIFCPSRWSRTLRRYRRIGGAAKQLETVTVTSTTGASVQAVQFTGSVGQGDRCIRAKSSLARPKLITARSMQAAGCHGFLGRLRKKRVKSFRPFVAPFWQRTADDELVVNMTPRLFSYFEVSILPDPNKQEEEEQEDDFRHPVAVTRPADCVAVGLATKDFSLHTRMPGWDSESWGYHGDDGGLFHNSGNMLEAFGPRYGAGDTIGCGMDYVTGRMFYTLNGVFLGRACQIPKEILETQDLFPVVGMDTHCPVSVNFGCDRPFQYDLNPLLHEQAQIVKDVL